MIKYRFQGLGIAPTRIFLERSYDMNSGAEAWSNQLNSDYDFCVPSMQLIWYGRKNFLRKMKNNDIARPCKEGNRFCGYHCMQKSCFGCPRNRNLLDGADESIAVAFFKKLGNYAYSKGTVIGVEANPPIYNTNYINDTDSALNSIEKFGSKGFLLNLNLGTMIQNEEGVRVSLLEK